MVPVVLVGPLLLLRLPMARTRRLCVPGAAFLVAVTAVAALLMALFPRGLFEITLAALVVTVATVVVASVTERRRRTTSPAAPAPARGPSPSPGVPVNPARTCGRRWNGTCGPEAGNGGAARRGGCWTAPPSASTSPRRRAVW